MKKNLKIALNFIERINEWKKITIFQLFRCSLLFQPNDLSDIISYIYSVVIVICFIWFCFHFMELYHLSVLWIEWISSQSVILSSASMFETAVNVLRIDYVPVHSCNWLIKLNIKIEFQGILPTVNHNSVSETLDISQFDNTANKKLTNLQKRKEKKKNNEEKHGITTTHFIQFCNVKYSEW